MEDEGLAVEFHEDEEIIEVIELNDSDPSPEDVANELEDIEVAGDNHDAHDEEWETEDEGIDESTEPVQDDSEVTFSKHSGLVFCVSLDPKSNTLAVTGGEDDKAFVWRVSDGELQFEITGHTDSVVCASFNHDSSLVATGDMNGIIKVWKVESKEEIWAFEVGDLEWMDWHPCAQVLMVGTTQGSSWMWKIPSGECKTFQGPSCPATCGKFLPDGRRAVIGYEDGTVRFWDLKQGNAIHVLKGHDGHLGSLTCVAVNKDGSLVLTGSVDSSTKLLNTNTGKVVDMFLIEGKPPRKPDLDEEKEEKEFISVESVAFCNVLPLIAIGHLNGMLAIYDISTQTLRHHCQHETGIVKVLWEENSPLVYSCSMDGTVRLWDARSGKLLNKYSGHTAEILDFTINREASVMVTAAGDGKAKVFCLQRPDR